MQNELKIVRELMLELDNLDIPMKEDIYTLFEIYEIFKKAQDINRKALAALDKVEKQGFEVAPSTRYNEYMLKTYKNSEDIKIIHNKPDDRQLVEAKQSVKIIRRLYHFIDDQSKISCIAAALEWLAQNNFEIIYYSRPVSNNPHYPNLEFIAQNKEGISEEKYREFKEWERFPLNKISAYEKAKLKGE